MNFQWLMRFPFLHPWQLEPVEPDSSNFEGFRIPYLRAGGNPSSLRRLFHPQFGKHFFRHSLVLALDSCLIGAGFTIGCGDGEGFGLPRAGHVTKGHGSEMITEAAFQSRDLDKEPRALDFVRFSRKAGFEDGRGILDHGCRAGRTDHDQAFAFIIGAAVFPEAGNAVLPAGSGPPYGLVVGRRQSAEFDERDGRILWSLGFLNVFRGFAPLFDLETAGGA